MYTWFQGWTSELLTKHTGTLPDLRTTRQLFFLFLTQPRKLISIAMQMRRSSVPASELLICITHTATQAQNKNSLNNDLNEVACPNAQDSQQNKYSPEGQVCQGVDLEITLS